MNNLDYKHINEVCKYFYECSPTLDAVMSAYFKDGFYHIYLEMEYNSYEVVKIQEIYIFNPEIFTQFKKNQ